MAASAGITGFGTLLAVATASTGAYTTIGEPVSIEGPNISSSDIDFFHMQSPNQFREFKAGAGDGGEITVEMNYVEADASTIYALHRADRWFRVTDSGSSTWICQGYVRDIQPGFPEDDRATMSVTIKLSGKPTFTVV